MKMFQEIKDQKHPLHYLLPPVKVSNSQMGSEFQSVGPETAKHLWPYLVV